MKKTLHLLSILFLLCYFANAQGLPCGGGRFVSRVFAASSITPGVLYGRNTTYMGVVKDLYMDIYQPTGDAATIRPLFIYAFGGAFVNGDRTQLASLCDSMARKGYVTVAIDYRLYDNPIGLLGLLINPNDGIDAVAKGMSDIKAAIRYFKRDAATTKTYRIDSTNIFVGGISSGSMIALHTSYINTLSEAVPPVSSIITTNGGMEGNTDLPGSPLIGTYSFQGLRGVWNMSGALYDSGYIKAGDPILFGIHGTADNVVPFGYGRLFSGVSSFGSFVCGSATLNNQAIQVGVQSRFLPVVGGDHESMYYLPSTTDLLDTAGPRFFGNSICQNALPATGILLKGIVSGKQVQLSWQTVTEIDNKAFVIEKQTASGWETMARVNSKAPNGNAVLPLYYSCTDADPAQGYNTYRLHTISLSGSLNYYNTIQVMWSGKPESQFVIYPNPATGFVNLKLALPQAITKTVKIYTSDMRLVKTSNVTIGSQSILVSNLAKGLYMVVVTDGKKGENATGWFIKE